MTEKPKKSKVMFKCEGGFIMSKRQMKTAVGDSWWQFAKNLGTSDGMNATAEIFKEHGYDVVPWDDDQESSDGSAVFTNNTEGSDGSAVFDKSKKRAK